MTNILRAIHETLAPDSEEAVGSVYEKACPGDIASATDKEPMLVPRAELRATETKWDPANFENIETTSGNPSLPPIDSVLRPKSTESKADGRIGARDDGGGETDDLDPVDTILKKFAAIVIGVPLKATTERDVEPRSHTKEHEAPALIAFGPMFDDLNSAVWIAVSAPIHEGVLN